jgi:mannonate dehydratase
MKIREARTIVTCPGRNYVLYKIVTDAGVYGVGDGTLNGRELAVAETLEKHISPLLIGRDPGRIEDIWQLLYRGTYWRGGPVLMTALAAVDMALWDIKGKVCNQPLYSLLGGKTRDGAWCYTHCAGRDFAEAVECVQAALERGFRHVRVQVAIPGLKSTYGQGGEKEAALAVWGDGQLPFEETWEPAAYMQLIPRLFEQVRAAVGDEVELLHDVHERLTPLQAARLAQELEPYRLYFLEDPIRPEHAHSLQLIRQASTTPIAMGELYTSPAEWLTPVTGQLIDFIRCDLAHVGGITAGRKIAAIAEPFAVQSAWHGPGDVAPITHAANVHLDVSIPNFGVQEMVFFPELVQEVIPGGPVYRDGRLFVSDAPGLGTDVDEAAAARYPYHRAYLPVCRRADGAVHDW